MALASPSPWPASRFPRLIFVGASTGGTEALRELLQGVPADCPPILVVQHMPELFTASFARRLDGLVAPRVLEAAGQEPVVGGTVFIAPGNAHLKIVRGAGGFVTALARGVPPVNRHIPAVDVLFDAAAAVVGRDAVGVLLTGMGKDGAQGLLRMRQAGAYTLAQDEESCVVYGMPREAVRLGAADEVLPLSEMARCMLLAARRR